MLALYRQVDMLHQQVQTLQARVRELERRLGQNSSHSGQPPSRDGYRKPPPKSLRGNGGRPSSAEQAVRSAVAAGQDRLPPEQRTALEAPYDRLVAQGLAAHPLPAPRRCRGAAG